MQLVIVEGARHHVHFHTVLFSISGLSGLSALWWWGQGCNSICNGGVALILCHLVQGDGASGQVNVKCFTSSVHTGSQNSSRSRSRSRSRLSACCTCTCTPVKSPHASPRAYFLLDHRCRSHSFVPHFDGLVVAAGAKVKGRIDMSSNAAQARLVDPLL